MQKIIIIGCPGAGKSTLAKALGEKTGLPVVHLDKLFWRSGWVHVSREEFDALLTEAMQKDAWIIDGNYSRTLPMRLDACDTVIYLDFPTIICLWGVVKRVISAYGNTRDDMGEGCPERFDPEFMQYVRKFNKENRDKMHHMLSHSKDKQIIILKSHRQVKNFLLNC